jgi:hypothetical protein
MDTSHQLVLKITKPKNADIMKQGDANWQAYATLLTGMRS